MNRFRQILAVLLFVPAMMLAQSPTENYVKAETMLNADGNNAMVSVQNDQKNPVIAVIAGVHEYFGHYKNGWSSHDKVVPFLKSHKSWIKTTTNYKNYINDVYKK